MIGIKSLYKLNISDEKMLSLNTVEKAGFIVLAFKNDNASGGGFIVKVVFRQKDESFRRSTHDGSVAVKVGRHL